MKEDNNRTGKDSTTNDGKLNRRSVLRKTTTAATVGGLGLSQPASASSFGVEDSELRFEQVELQDDELKHALNSETTAVLLDYLKNDDVVAEEAEKYVLNIEGAEFGSYIKLPCGVGELCVISYDGAITRAYITLDRDKVHNSTSAKIQATAEWPDEKGGYLTNTPTEDGPKFSRAATDEETQDIRDLTNVQDGEIHIDIDQSLPDISKGKPTREYIVVHDDQYFRIDESRSSITESGTIGDDSEISFLATTCQNKAGICAGDIILGFIGCTPGFLTCSITGPIAVGCVVALLAVCAPEAALVTVSGNCAYVARNCV